MSNETGSWQIVLSDSIFLAIFMIHFCRYVYRKDFITLGISRRIFSVFKFMVFEIQILPLLHTTLIKVICTCMDSETTSKVIFFQFPKAVPVKSAVEELHGRIFLRNKYVF